MSVDKMLFLNMTHPAARGLCGGSAVLSCCSFLSSRKNHTLLARTSTKNRLLKSGLNTTGQFWSELNVSSLLHRATNSHMLALLPVTAGGHHALMKVRSPKMDQKAIIHSQRPEGDKQAQQYFILSPKGLFNASPESWKPYLNLIRLDRPIGKK